MPLLVSLSRDAQDLDLGDHESVTLTDTELKGADGRLLAKHLDNRWFAGERRQAYARLNIAGPLTVSDPAGMQRLGPYMQVSMYDGVSYVDNRVFAFTDVQQRDWYIHDAGEHWKVMTIAFHPTGP